MSFAIISGNALQFSYTPTIGSEKQEFNTPSDLATPEDWIMYFVVVDYD